LKNNFFFSKAKTWT